MKKQIKNAIIDDINRVFGNFGISDQISIEHISLGDSTVSDLAVPEKKLSKIIMDYYWPSEKRLTVYHYTTREAAKNILGRKKFRLYNIKKRINEDEIGAFCKLYNLDGYLQILNNGNPYYQDVLAKNLFYASFTGIDLSIEKEKYFWNSFSSIEGVRLKLEITARNPDFRKIYYGRNKDNDLLNCLNKCISNYDRKFVFEGISKMCAFFLPEEYRNEKEYRILYRHFDGSDINIQREIDNEYVEIDLDKFNKIGFNLNIIEVMTNEELPYYNGIIFKKRL